jgi:hypothetical protein
MSNITSGDKNRKTANNNYAKDKKAKLKSAYR